MEIEKETSQDKQIDIISAADQYVKKQFRSSKKKGLFFHNYAHAQEIVGEVKKLTKNSDLNEEEKELLILAAYFHDVGFINDAENHLEGSAKVATTFLEDHGYEKDKTAKVNELILSTKRLNGPENFLEELLNDACISYIGRKRFFRKSELLRAEREFVNNEEFTEQDWQQKQYNFLLDQSFITRQAQKKYNRRRRKNVEKQRSNVNSAKKVTRRLQTGKDFGRGIDTLYRSNYRNHINFSSIADGKANMMISINTILISIIITLSGASFSVFEDFRLESYRFTIPIFILLIGSLISVFFAVMSARPKVTEKDVSKKTVRKRDVSLLFFGNFLEVSKEEFANYLSQLKNNQKELYDSMSYDIYDLGVVLKRKYQLLSISYTVFIAGLTLSVIGFFTIFIITNT